MLGGILEFGIIYQVAFSEPGTSAPQTSRTEESSSPPKSVKSVRAASPNREDTKEKQPVVAAAVASAAAPAPTLPPVEQAQAIDSPTEAPPVDIIQVTIHLARDLLIPILAVADAPETDSDAAPGDASPAPEVTPLEPEKPAPPAPIDLSTMPVEEVIRHVFGPEGKKAVEVARCESTLRTHAKQGQYLGLFQMGANERARYGHGEDVVSQVRAAHALFMHRGWQPWTCA